ncbi:MAG: FABP family protein [Candidatus Limnocylindria bacterium]
MPVEPLLAALVGTWRGEGSGEFPTMDSFGYEEEVRFLDIGSGDLVYLQRAWAPSSGEVLHAEAGIWRAVPDGKLVVTIAQPRRTEVSEGRIQDGVIEIASTGSGHAIDAAPVNASRRRYRLSVDELTYEFEMATPSVAEPTRHLLGTLRRLGEPPPSA